MSLLAKNSLPTTNTFSVTALIGTAVFGTYNENEVQIILYLLKTIEDDSIYIVFSNPVSCSNYFLFGCLIYTLTYLFEDQVSKPMFFTTP